MIKLLAQVKEVSTKTTADLTKTTKIVLYTQDPVAGALESMPAETLVNVTIQGEDEGNV